MFKTTHTFQYLLRMSCLPFSLRFYVHMLILATTTRVRQAATRLLSIRTWLDYLQQVRFTVILKVAIYSDMYKLSWNDTGNKDYPFSFGWFMVIFVVVYLV